MKRRKLRVAVLFGGKSGEHEVSLASARSVMEAMDKSKYEIYPIGITKEGYWLLHGDPMAVLSAGKKGDRLPSGREGELIPGLLGRDFPQVDVVFPVLHGTYGEDGTIQGLLELADLPYVGAGVLGSALGLDKAVQKVVLRAHGLPVVDYKVYLRSRWQQDPERILAEIEEHFAYPVFVKPANLGSSVGVSKAHHREELRKGLDLAARFDRKLLVEEGVNAREIECSVLGNDEPIASVPGEVVPCNEFYDYKAKYLDGSSELHIPAELEEEQRIAIQRFAVEAFRAIDCAGMARVDFFLCRDTGKVYINELNTIPGFTEISMYPKLWEASGIPYPELIDRLIGLALERYEEKKALETVYRFDH
ncbi:MAG: D-alanine--D-alanine ligase [Anaerolineae bacterium]|nr:D-alanine--D-alanine ligase [Anaerolineae bacterium]